MISGRAHPAVVEAIARTAAKGSVPGAPTEEENMLASFVMERIPFIERMRFVSSGTEAVMSAIRLARGATKRDLIIKFDGCYHGHFDSLLVNAGSGLATFGTSSSAGVPEALAQLTLVVPLNDEEALEAAFAKHGGRMRWRDRRACSREQWVATSGQVLPVEAARTLHETRSVLIFDEVISGFRVGFAGSFCT
ncbi:MAG: aminotransferase class III-fold pyridoxal phosphate-dependent enzyme [Flavobacteriales bacterium]|nr:aminotransferase class III-fold pyridoxal phosphate-dependent enzyme [Flavobacteriales bacterium]